MTPEESAVWFRSHKAQFRKLEALTCDCEAGDRPLAVMYAHGDGRRMLWIQSHQGLDQSGQTMKVHARAIDPDVAAGLEITQCPRCRRGVMIEVRPGDSVVPLWLDSPTNGVISE